ncbi:MAG: flagellar filament capping protein FliD [Fibromonadales bacterium]|nr:flagellar filament capping protein FliD [Fibromonadales bacterium]
MAGMSVGGLVSGLDTNSIIAQLTALEQAKVTREITKKENAQKTLDKFKELQSRLGNLASKAAALELPDRFNVFKSTSNYDDYASISGKEGATAGQYELVIKQLASTQKVSSKKIDAVNTPLVASGDLNAVFGGNETVKITLSKTAAAIKADPGKKTVEVTISKTDTLKDVVNKINAAEGAGVKASIMTMGDGDNRLVLTSVETGSKGFSISDDCAANSNESLLEYLGILKLNADQVATSGNALVDSNGKVATGESTFNQFDTVFTKIVPGDVVGIYLPTNNGSGSPGWVTFDLFSGSTLGSAKSIDEVLEKINDDLDDAGANIVASINDAGEIVLSGNLSGDQNFDNLSGVKIQIGAFDQINQKFDEVKKDLGGFTSTNVFANVINEGKNAIYTVDGIAVSSQSNTDDKTISGTVFTLKKISADGMEPIKLSLEPDMGGLADRIGAFIEEYNALIKFIDENAKSSVKEEEDKVTGKKVSKREVGVFSGDSNISSLRENLKQMLTKTIDEIANIKDAKGKIDNGYSTIYSSAARIGITTQKDGSISVDRTALIKALNADFEGVRKLFTANSFSNDSGLKIGNFNKNSTTGVYEIKAGDMEVWSNGKLINSTGWGSGIITLANGISIEMSDPNRTDSTGNVTFVRGIASMITNFVEKAKNTVDGYFKQSEKTYQARIDSIQKRVDELQIRVNNYSDRITKQFSLLERSMGNLQSQTANMMSALSSISYK